MARVNALLVICILLQLNLLSSMYGILPYHPCSYPWMNSWRCFDIPGLSAPTQQPQSQLNASEILCISSFFQACLLAAAVYISVAELEGCKNKMLISKSSYTRIQAVRRQ